MNPDDNGPGVLSSGAIPATGGSCSPSPFAGRVGAMEIPAQMHAEPLHWPLEYRPRCHSCKRLLHRARQIDGTVIQFCETGCRSELGFPFSAAEFQAYSQNYEARTA